jgi:cell shape-determining protein MreD
MRSGWALWGLVVGLFFLHFLLHVGFGIGGAAPDLLTVALLLVAREVELGTAAGVGLAFGLLEDALSVLSFGATGFAMTVVGMVGAATRDLFVGDSLLFLGSYFLLGKWIRDLLHWVAAGDALRQPFLDQVVIQGFWAAGYAAAVGLLLTELIGLRKDTDG